jgi:hypothetical protein
MVQINATNGTSSTVMSRPRRAAPPMQNGVALYSSQTRKSGRLTGTRYAPVTGHYPGSPACTPPSITGYSPRNTSNWPLRKR